MTSLNDLLNKSGDPLLFTRLDGGIIWANQAALSLFEISQNQPFPSIFKLLSEPDARRVLGVKSFESVPVKYKQSALTAIVTDVTGAGLDDEAVMIMFKPVSSSSDTAQKEEWLVTVAHDIKSPLGAIFGYADTLLDTPIGSGLSDVHRHLVTRIRASASRALDLVRNFQHLSAIEIRGVAASSTLIDVNKAVREVLESTWREDSMAPPVNLITGEPSLARIDRSHLERVLSNLLTNAIKFSPPDAPVTIKTWAEPQRACISFHNGGKSIPESEIRNLFKRYSRLSNSSDKPGTGLGLYIVQKIVTGVGGNVEVESSVKDGTTFTIRIPGA